MRTVSSRKGRLPREPLLVARPSHAPLPPGPSSPRRSGLLPAQDLEAWTLGSTPGSAPTPTQPGLGGRPAHVPVPACWVCVLAAVWAAALCVCPGVGRHPWPCPEPSEHPFCVWEGRGGPGTSPPSSGLAGGHPPGVLWVGGAGGVWLLRGHLSATPRPGALAGPLGRASPAGQVAPGCPVVVCRPRHWVRERLGSIPVRLHLAPHPVPLAVVLCCRDRGACVTPTLTGPVLCTYPLGARSPRWGFLRRKEADPFQLSVSPSPVPTLL